MLLKIFATGFLVSQVVSSVSFAAIPEIQFRPQKSQEKYQVSLRVGLSGSLPIAINSAVRAGKKSSFSEISSDGQTETRVEILPRKSRMHQDSAVLMDIKVARYIRGEKKAEESVQILTKENEEAEILQKGSKTSKLTLSVLARLI